MLILWFLRRRRARRDAVAEEAVPAGGGARSPVRLVVHQFRFDVRAFARDKQARFTTLALPVVLLVAFVSIGGGNKTVVQDGRRIASASFYVPGLIALAIVSASFASLVVDLVGQRESGVLKRRRATPVPPWALIGGRAATAVTVSLATALLLLLAGGNIYDIHVPGHALPGVALTVVLGSISFTCFAYAIAPSIRSSGALQPILQLVLFPLYAMSGVLLPDSKNPGWLRDVARALPLEHVSHGLHHAFDPHGGLGLSLVDVLVLALWTAVAFAVAVKRFSWLPTAATAS
jgi:ABC-2 type transport system permease protein